VRWRRASEKNKPWETLIGKVLVKYYHKQSRLERLLGIEVILLGDIREMEETIKCMMDTPKMTAKYGYSPGSSSDCKAIALKHSIEVTRSIELDKLNLSKVRLLFDMEKAKGESKGNEHVDPLRQKMQERLSLLFKQMLRLDP
jgi:hypothetical protein